MMKRLPKLTLAFLVVCFALNAQAQCPDNIIDNYSFEEANDTTWWSWHDNSPDAYTFEKSDDAFEGDSSMVINILVDTDSIPGGQGAEYNSRPQTNAVIGGQFYEIKFAAKSTRADTQMPIYIKDENDGWILLHQEVVTIGTEWTEVSSIWQADTDRPDIHLELKVYNAEFHEPYSINIDAVEICQVEILTNTCADNIVTDPGFENGEGEWWTWHGGDETDYTFEIAAEGLVGNASAKILVLKPGAELTGVGEYNSRPQTSPVIAEQNYKVTLYGKSTLENTIVQAWVKDENDGWTTIGNSDLTIGTDWTEASFVFTADVDREDVHVELKVVNPDFTEPYEVWMDEVSICKTDDEPGDTGEPTGPEPVFGSDVDVTTCINNEFAEPFSDVDEPNDGLGWDIWDGSDDEELSTFAWDPVLPFSGDGSVRIDVTEAHDVAEFHHRFGADLLLEDGQEYTVSLWMRTNVPEGDSIRAFTRAVRDTDWSAQFFVDMITSTDTWLNYAHTFTADGTWDNAFLEIKLYRNTEFADAYSVWFDDIQICPAADTETTTATTDFDQIGVNFQLAPNPVASSVAANLNVHSPEQLNNTQIQLIDLLGRTIWTKEIDLLAGEQSIRIETAGLASGLYLVNVRHQQYQASLKLQVLNRP